MNHVIDALKAEQAQLRDRLAKIDAAIEEYERWAQSVAVLVRDKKASVVENPDLEIELKQTPMAEFEVEVRALLERTPAPLKRNEVYDELSKAGVVVGGKEPLNTVASRLSRMTGVINLKGFGYWLENRPYAPAEHLNEPNSMGALFNRADLTPAHNLTDSEDVETSNGDA
jgi:hypothetical protein